MIASETSRREEGRFSAPDRPEFWSRREEHGLTQQFSSLYLDRDVVDELLVSLLGLDVKGKVEERDGGSGRSLERSRGGFVEQGGVDGHGLCGRPSLERRGNGEVGGGGEEV